MKATLRKLLPIGAVLLSLQPYDNVEAMKPRKEPQGSKPNFFMTGLTGFHQDQLRYMQHLDLELDNPEMSYEDMMWEPVLIMDHWVKID